MLQNLKSTDLILRSSNINSDIKSVVLTKSFSRMVYLFPHVDERIHTSLMWTFGCTCQGQTWDKTTENTNSPTWNLGRRILARTQGCGLLWLGVTYFYVPVKLSLLGSSTRYMHAVDMNSTSTLKSQVYAFSSFMTSCTRLIIIYISEFEI